jgi:protein-disulfide isomerase
MLKASAGEGQMNDQSRSRNYPKIFGWMLLPLILLAAAGIGLAAERRVLHQPKAGNTVADMPQDEFERRVRTYLLEHPEVITEAISRLEARQAEQDAAQVKTLLKEYADEIFRDPDSPVGGNREGDVTLVEFFDYNCPYCPQMAPLMTQAEAEDPQLRIVYKEFPILGPNSVIAAKAALAAKKQDKYVAFHRALYQIRGPVEEGKVLAAAATVGLDVDRLKADMQDLSLQGLVDKNIQLAQALRITGTPGFVAGDQILVGATDLKTLQAVLQTKRGKPQATK